MATTTFKLNEIVLLLGAGASVEAGIPDSSSMVLNVEEIVSGQGPNWKRHEQLYRYIRSSIYYADGINGFFGDKVQFNIERLVNVIEELQRRERHTLYPFVGAWHPKLSDLAGPDFENVNLFHRDIIEHLRHNWMALRESESAAYYKGLMRFQEDYGHPLRVFSLNYDLCVEQVCGMENVQRGFSERTWDWRVFDETSKEPVPIMLYKLHGSVDWYFKDGRVKWTDVPSSIKPEDIALIFGTSYKLQYVDPFLYHAYELRRWTLEAARIIVCIGYGFNDAHINGILKQSLRQDEHRRFLTVTGPICEADIHKLRARIAVELGVPEGRIEISASGAREFLNSELTIPFLSEFFPPETDLFPEI